MEIRQLRAADVTAVVDCWNAAVEAQQEGYEKHTLDEEAIANLRESDHYLPSGAVIAEDGNSRVSGVAVAYLEDGGSGAARIAGVAVHPDHWRRGVGSRLLERLEEAAAAEGKSDISYHIYKQPTKFVQGPYLDTGPHRFFASRGYRITDHAMRLRNEFDRFTLPDWVPDLRATFEEEDIEFTLLESTDRDSLLELLDEHFSDGWHARFERSTARDDHPDVPIVKDGREDEVIGFMGPCWVDSETGEGSIGTPGLHPDYRGRGIGRTRFFLGLDHLKQSGAEFADYRTGYDRVGEDAATEMYFDSGARLLEVLAQRFHKPLS